MAENKNMELAVQENQTEQTKASPDMIKEINGVRYVVRAHFKEDKGETLEQKIKRMLRNEVQNMNLAV